MSWAIVAGAAVGLVGSVVSSNSAEDAADTQASAADRASAGQERMFNKQVELQQPWMDAGKAGLSQLNRLLGVTPVNSNDGSPANPYSLNDFVAYNDRIAPNHSFGQQGRVSDANDQFRQYQAGGYGNDQNAIAQRFGFDPGRIAQAQAQAAQTQTTNQNDPTFGSLLKPFSQADFQSDPGYQFRQSEGENALQRAASARTGVNSGKFYKDAMRFNQGLASQDYGAAFDRFNVGQTNQFNRLASLSGIGQTAANQTGAAASNFGSQIGSNIIGAGNALAAGRVGGANAINGGLSQGLSMYQNNQMMNRLFPQSGSQNGGYRYTVPTYDGAEY